MAIPFLNNIDLSDNQLLNAKLQVTHPAPTAAPGQIYYNSVSNTAQYHNNSTWVTLGEDTKYTFSAVEVIPGTIALAIAGSDTSVYDVELLAGNNITLSISGNEVTINAADAPSGTVDLIGDVLASGTTGSNITTAFNFAGSSIITSGEGIGTNNVDTALVTSAAVKSYVDSAVSGGAGAMVFQGSYNAATNSPDLDTSPAGINKGFAYAISASGVFFTEALEVGDLIVANIDNPTTLNDWTRIQKNVDLATVSTVGIGNVAAGSGVNVSYANGTATVSTTTTGFATTIAASTPLITHSLNSTDVIVQLFDTVTGETVYADVERTSANTVDVTFATAPTNPVRVLVTKI